MGKIKIQSAAFVDGQFSATYYVSGDDRLRGLELPALCVLRCAEHAGLIRTTGDIIEYPGTDAYYYRQRVRIIEERRNPMTGEIDDVIREAAVCDIAEEAVYANPSAIIRAAEDIYPEFVGVDFPAAFQVTTVERFTL